ncbi:hypothetical protein GGTG_13850 [Gaeumannomyces tritici R3-111a-1]|uniref:Aminoglycoside phosphotransferase domain-containing protein n=1 Tax=Gaeumannomyces tritici (strain R3-111a-1) TaxID=644352 RepID=J3PK05_GAET3|nr:hypothetical protein GGTG_13850 [Gaeumannomyces tritici R3-111a-1]EJT68575.1 hypothetical protein GGTG_13850 [Gaeumannomyces tritici R3-111a-1]
MEHLLKYVPSRAAVLTVSPVVNQRFFERNPGLTEQICLEQAAQILGCPASSIRPVAIQGAESFTVTKTDARPGDSGIVQFRDLSSPLNIDTLALARRTYGDMIPACNAITCGLSDKAHVYLMTLAGGIAFCAAKQDFYQDHDAERLTATVVDFASFVASSLSTARQNADDAALAQAYEKLAPWEASLPARFQPRLAEVRARLPAIFGGEFPQVLNHADLVEMNIQADGLSGGIAGVIDWEGAAYGPFGVALASLETLLGVCTGEGVWIWHPGQERLRAFFYETLTAELGRHPQARYLGADDIEAARAFGLFIMYGSWAAQANDHDNGSELGAACLEVGLGEGTAVQPFLQLLPRGGHRG